ncbi:MAG: hypothetical protein K0R50_4198 [Eubacterium sp.]|jgi:hypothetical protein|nr:hypothetical protein [Eubacterium sp.]
MEEYGIILANIKFAGENNMRLYFAYVLLILTILITGCGQQSDELHKQSVFQYKNSTLELTKKVKTLSIKVDSANLQIYCWDNPEIKYEIKHTVRDKKSDEQLEKLLEKFSIETNVKDNVCTIIVNYNGKIKNTQDILSQIKLTIPRRIKSMIITQEQGIFTVEDKYEGNINAELNSVNSEIKSMCGVLVLKCKNGNARLNSGELSNGSEVNVETGNIYIKAQCKDMSKYLFKTDTGNVDLTFPVASNIKLDLFGTITNNQFTGMDGSIDIIASTNIGKISVDGY